MPQPAQAPPEPAAAAGAAGVGVTAAAGAAAAAGLATAVGAIAAGILAALVAFLAALRELHRRWLVTELGRYGQSDDISRVVADEMEREVAFAKASADRVASALPQLLAIKDPQERVAKVRQLLADEERYARQRSEAMAARAIAAVTRLQLRRDSPLGAFWRLGLAHKHTAGCLFMADKFWPWAVLDRVHPPRHYGCTSQLVSFGEAIHNGWMTAGDVPAEKAAIRMASGVVMEAEEADGLVRELELRERLVELGVTEAALAGIPAAPLNVEQGGSDADE